MNSRGVVEPVVGRGVGHVLQDPVDAVVGLLGLVVITALVHVGALV